MNQTARDDVVLTLTEADDVSIQEIIRRRRLALICHYVARSSALIFYLFCSWFTTAFIAPVVILLTLFALDFWLVKNISGRLLVRLRWWNSVNPQTGASTWIFESANTNSLSRDDGPISNRERSSRRFAGRLFWIGLLVFPLIWFLLVIVAIFSLKLAWCLVAACGCLACSVNAYGYLKCRFRGTPVGEDSTKSGLRGLLTAAVAKSVISDLWSDEENKQQQQQQQPTQQPPSLI
ncbi:hypothetical protein Aperf_G00000124794 [Anoplocephala perfoliata]